MRRYNLKATGVIPALRKDQEELNPFQYTAVTAGDGPHLVIAGATSPWMDS